LTEVILEEMDEDSTEDVLDDTVEDSSGKFSKKSFFLKIKNFFKQIFSSKKRILIIAVSLVIGIIIITGCLIFFLKKSPDETMNAQNNIAPGENIETALTQEQEIVFEDIVELEPFERIPLKAGSIMSLVSVNLSLELIDHRYRKQIYTMEDRIRKIITGQVEEMTWLVLRSPEGKIMLKYNLLKRINSIFPKPVARNIYFTLFIMQ